MARQLAICALLCCFLPMQVFAAAAMRITSIDDFNLGSWGIGDPAISEYSDICIYGLNIPALTSYAITISSTPSGYRLQSGANFIAYGLHWEDNVLGGLGTQLTDGVKLDGQTNLNILSQTCAIGGPNARLTIQITQAEMTAALAGTYAGVITLLLSPD
ncbi:MAG: hypothetical protein AB7L92_03700 [Alphaproteobacteria bacterium]